MQSKSKDLTFSIVACDPESASGPEWGVAVASKFLAVGAAVPWGQAGAGAVATQALANLAYGPQGLERLGRGEGAQSVVDALTGADEERDQRQLGIVDAAGGASTYTGVHCFEWAGGVTGPGFCCQGNILVGPAVVDEMKAAFENAQGELAVRLLTALRAGDAAGGDRRGRQSAALLIVRKGGGYGGGSDRAVDLRVDDNADPTTELERLFDLHRLYFPRPEDLEFIPVDESLAAELRSLLGKLDFSPGTGPGYDDDLRAALFAYSGIENLEERWSDDTVIEKRVLEHLQAR
jgi:uncharacterized Ntn-hydrolase superfamily protein